MPGYSKLATQVLGLLSLGLLLGYARGQRQRYELKKEADGLWRAMDREALFRILRFLKMKKMIEVIEKSDGERSIKITKSGRERAREFQIQQINVARPAKWDGRWRIVIFDIPEKRKKMRDGLRRHLKRLGFHELQKSVFVVPYPCEREIQTITKLMDLEGNLRYLEASFSFDKDLRKEFSLP